MKHVAYWFKEENSVSGKDRLGNLMYTEFFSHVVSSAQR